MKDKYGQTKLYDFKRYLDTLPKQKNFIASLVEFDTSIEQRYFQLKTEDFKYWEKVTECYLDCWDCAKKDRVVFTELDDLKKVYTLWGTDRPQATHQIGDYSNPDFETWSKDITWKDRLIYNIYPDGYVKIVSIEFHDNPNFYKDFSINEGDTGLKLFSNVEYGFLEQRRQWIQEHAHMSKQSRDMIMPLHLKYPDIQPFSSQFEEASKVAEQKVLKHIRKEKLPEVPKLTPKLLYDNEIRGTLIERRVNREWKVIK